jgi:hypothetical protein
MLTFSARVDIVDEVEQDIKEIKEKSRFEDTYTAL